LAFTFCWWESSDLLEAETPAGVAPQPKEPDSASQTRTPEGEKRSDAPHKAPDLSWPVALRRVRAWLEPYVMLMRYWRAFSDLPPPEELKALLEWVFSGKGLYLYAR
jgi:hypothetical protein